MIFSASVFSFILLLMIAIPTAFHAVANPIVAAVTCKFCLCVWVFVSVYFVTPSPGWKIARQREANRCKERRDRETVSTASARHRTVWCLDWQLQQKQNGLIISKCTTGYSSYSPAGRGSPKLNDDVKKPKGKAPMPKDMWKLSPKPKPGKTCAGSGSVRCPAGRGGTLLLSGQNRKRERGHD